MPRGDGSGPDGMGPVTGRGFGYCTGHDHPGYVVPGGMGRGMGWGRGRGWGRGLGRGRGFGWRGRRYGYDVPANYQGNPAYNRLDPQDEKTYIKEEIGGLTKELETLQKRLDELEKE